MTEYKHVGKHAEELAGGVMLGPGETTDLSGEQEKENERLIKDGILVPAGSQKTGSKKKEETSSE
jgi:hypothetical protein